MANSQREPDWQDRPEEPADDAREPFFWLFVLLAVVLGVLVVTRAGDAGTDATFAAGRSPADTESTPLPLPTVDPTPVPESAPVLVEVAYSATAIEVVGTVPAQAVADAVIAASAELVGAGAVLADLVVDESSSPSGGLLVLIGEVQEESERATVVEAYADVGLEISDRLVLAGSQDTVAQILTSDPDLGQLADFITAAGLLGELEAASEEGVTLFAPTDDAIEGLDRIALDELADAEELSQVLRYHLVDGVVGSDDLGDVTALTSQQGESIPIASVDGMLLVGGASITTADIEAVNGIVHVVDAVLLPGTLRTEVALNELVTQEPILFAPGSAELLDESLPTLDRVATILLDNRFGRVEVQGHTDSDGPAEVNLELSQRRADAVVAYLVEAGVGPGRLTARGYGETELKVDPEESDEDKAANRRIEFRVG